MEMIINVKMFSDLAAFFMVIYLFIFCLVMMKGGGQNAERQRAESNGCRGDVIKDS